MNKIFKNFIVASVFFSFVCVPTLVQAQQYKGAYSADGGKKEVKKDKAARPVPKIFSSKLTSVEQGRKLDLLFDDLRVSLWVYAGTDFIYQKKLYDLIRAEKFQYTRYAKEFSVDLKSAMESLNQNFNQMMSDIDNAEEKYKEIKEGIRMADQGVLEPLWEEKITAFRTNAESYFKMQSKFLNTYRNLVGFIMNQSGSYYYKKDENKVFFYKFGGYKYYGETIDKLRKVSFEQRKILKQNEPANADATLE